jgi:hypothetical protein
MSAEIEVRSQFIRLDEHGIVYARLKPQIEVGLADAEEAVRAIGSLCGGRKRPVLVDLTRARAMNRDARQYFAGAETARVESAAALLVGSPLASAIGNFFLGLNKPLFPTRLFTSERKALEWLQTFLE